ncbi:MAG: PAS domain-containing protein, partial [Desulfosarcinaceae bacterium]
MAPVGTKPINPVEEDGFARKVLDASLNGIYIYDLNLGQNIFINKQYTTLTGYTLDELNAMGREQFMALFHPDERQRVIEHMQNMACLDKGVLEVDYRFRTKDGRWIWCLSRDSVFSCTADGSVIQFIGTFIDITEHKQAHQELEHKRRLLSEAEKLSHTGAWEWDPDTGQWSFSEGWLSLHGCPMRTLKQEDLIALAHPQDRDRIVRAFGKVCKGEALYDLEHRIVRMDNGEVRLIHGLGRYVRDDAGKVVKVFGLSKDITDQRESEQALYQQRELMQHIFDVVPVLLVIWDPQMNRFTLNRYAETVFGWTTAEANQGDFMGMVYPDAAYRAEVETYMQSLQPG